MEAEDKSWFKKYVPWIIPVLICAWIPTIVLYTPAYQNAAYGVKSWFTSTLNSKEVSIKNIDKQIQSSKSNIAKLQSKLNDLMPDKPYILINTTENRFVLRNSKDTIRTGFCSTGKDEILIYPNGTRKPFKTPKGMFSVLLKRKSPVWVKPDWAFIEEGVKPPSARASERYDESTLGAYALSIGDGYMLHGTLYQRFIGLPVTHGCVRLGAADLEVIFNSLDKGAKVFIY
ncbi:MAG: L,D-transpeptidase [Bacteroidetes bacterium]|nr:L,D-transpeptidase [Bacteroidota bacterium]MCL6101676.1 L,D-transpeptidase [Bacteroidota bacterium]